MDGRTDRRQCHDDSRSIMSLHVDVGTVAHSGQPHSEVQTTFRNQNHILKLERNILKHKRRSESKTTNSEWKTVF